MKLEKLNRNLWTERRSLGQPNRWTFKAHARGRDFGKMELTEPAYNRILLVN